MVGVFDNAAGGFGNVAVNITYTLNIAPTANLVIIRTVWDTNGVPTAPTVNGISAVLVAANQSSVVGQEFMWWLQNPPTGVVSVNQTFNSRTGNSSAASYIGATVRDLPNPQGTNSAVTSTTGTVAVVTTVAQSTVVGSIGVFATPTAAPTAGANTVARNTQFANSMGGGIFDSNGPVAAVGSYTENFAWTGSSIYASIGLAFAPGADPAFYNSGTAGILKPRAA